MTFHILISTLVNFWRVLWEPYWTVLDSRAEGWLTSKCLPDFPFQSQCGVWQRRCRPVFYDRWGNGTLWSFVTLDFKVHTAVHGPGCAPNWFVNRPGDSLYGRVERGQHAWGAQHTSGLETSSVHLFTLPRVPLSHRENTGSCAMPCIFPSGFFCHSYCILLYSAWLIIMNKTLLKQCPQAACFLYKVFQGLKLP